MDERTVKDFKVGQLVKWYDLCGDNVVVLDSGTGIVMERHSHLKGYSVYRTQKKDTKRYNGYFLEAVK